MYLIHTPNSYSIPFQCLTQPNSLPRNKNQL
jgi:hypothetical protein